jgi:hypothetical protein
MHLLDLALTSAFGLVCGLAGGLCTLAWTTIRRNRKPAASPSDQASAFGPIDFDRILLAELEARAAYGPWLFHRARGAMDTSRYAPRTDLGRHGWDYEQ